MRMRWYLQKGYKCRCAVGSWQGPPSIRISHFLLGGDLARAQALEAEARKLYSVYSRGISQKNLRFAQPPLAVGQRQGFGRQELGTQFLQCKSEDERS